eukprot:COSAG04_NODE_2458_length_4089_cov_1.587469_3_plen_48_part_00
MSEGSEEEPEEGSWASFFAKNKKGIAAYLFIEVSPPPPRIHFPFPKL